MEFDKKDIHTRILEAGIFNYFSNQPAVLAYLNGQFVVRKGHFEKKEMMMKSLTNLQTNGVTQRFMNVPTKLLLKGKLNSEHELGRAPKVLADMNRFKTELVYLKTNCLDETQSVKSKKTEEYEYFSKEIEDLKILIKNMQVSGKNYTKPTFKLTEAVGLKALHDQFLKVGES